MARNEVFEFRDYKAYLKQTLTARSKTEKGQKHKLAEFIGCNAGYLSKVLGDQNDFSAEQAQSANRFLAHTPAEAKYFLNLVLLARAGTADLKSYFEEEIKKQKQDRMELKNRVRINRALSEADQARYYSSWIFAAIHVAISLDSISSKSQIAHALELPEQTVSDALELLVELGLLKRKGFHFEPGEKNLFISKDSPFINQHHTNWRVQAIRSLDRTRPEDLHYSGTITCAESDITKIREHLLKAIEEVRSTVRESKADEQLFCYTLDLFNLRRA